MSATETVLLGTSVESFEVEELWLALFTLNINIMLQCYRCYH